MCSHLTSPYSQNHCAGLHWVEKVEEMKSEAGFPLLLHELLPNVLSHIMFSCFLNLKLFSSPICCKRGGSPAPWSRDFLLEFVWKWWWMDTWSEISLWGRTWLFNLCWIFCSSYMACGIYPRILGILTDPSWLEAGKHPSFQEEQERRPWELQACRSHCGTCKIMEEIILGVSEKHCKANTLIGNSQHGFRRGESCG